MHEADSDRRRRRAVARSARERQRQAREGLEGQADGQAAGEESEGDFYVNVHLEDGTVVACGVLESKRRGHNGNAEADDGGKGHGHDKDKGHD
jgi:hypothetical protein